MTSHEPAAHPYRSLFNPFELADDLRVPYAGQTRMRLDVPGFAHGVIVIDPQAEDLIAVDYGDGPPPQLRVMAGSIALSRRTSFGDWLLSVLRPWASNVTIVLHPAVEWTIAIHGGVAHAQLELAAGAVARVDIHGGCSDVQLDLPRAEAPVPVRVFGGASQLVLRRPADLGVALTTSGGLSALRLDDQRFDAIGGAARLQTYSVGAPRYELEIHGGAAQLAIEPMA